MLYSVYNWNKRAYDVFESRSGEANGQRPRPRRVGPGPRGPGQQLESLLPILPLDAIRLRTARKPAGRIAIHHTSPAVGLGAWSAEESWLVKKPWLMLGVGAVGLVLGYRLLHHIARRL
jgi:hypothetical protein